FANQPATDADLVVAVLVEELEQARLQRLHHAAAATAHVRQGTDRLCADPMPRLVALRCGEARIKGLRCPVEQLESEHVGFELAGDAADLEGLRDQSEIEIARAHVGEELRMVAERILQADVAARDATAEYLGFDVAVEGEHVVL